ncbi:hypothetical protein BKA65DRAFT_540209 [Rhexocercosporidium sp. MPI-PUGE-AT-0058]|nr:hypothetical protein BKA65DRAFT_540209 [Rhexocercosporidium sp. MPI-PUGE-AT-0058]
MAPLINKNIAAVTKAEVIKSTSSSSIASPSCVVDPRQKTTTNKPHSKITADFLGISIELRHIIFAHALIAREPEIYDATPPLNPDPNRSPHIILLLLCKSINKEVIAWQASNPHLRNLPFAGLVDPATTIFKTSYTTIRERNPNFLHAWNNPVFQQNAQILQMDMPFDSCAGEDRWTIQDQETCREVWHAMMPFPSFKRIDLLSHGKLEASGKFHIVDAIWLKMGLVHLHRDESSKHEAYLAARPVIRWKNVNKVKGRWRVVVPWTSEEWMAYESKKRWVLCKRWGFLDIMDREYDEDEMEDFSEEEDESDEEDVPDEFSLEDLLPDESDGVEDKESEVHSDDESKSEVTRIVNLCIP